MAKFVKHIMQNCVNKLLYVLHFYYSPFILLSFDMHMIWHINLYN